MTVSELIDALAVFDSNTQVWHSDGAMVYPVSKVEEFDDPDTPVVMLG